MSITLQEFLAEWNSSADTVSVQTSGSTGTPKVLLVEKKRMLASAKLTCDFLGLKAGDTALLCMSLQHIGAKMVVVRSIERGLNLQVVEPSGHPLRSIEKVPDFAAMVPLQVYNSLQDAQEKEKLRNIKHLIIGGGAVSPTMVDELRQFPNGVWSSYGMTETLSHIALRRLSGPSASEWYLPFKGISVHTNKEQCLCIKAPMLCTNELVTNDIAEVRGDGSFRILGRKDNIINSGGVKIQIESVEEMLYEQGLRNFAISSYPDDKFGEIVVLLTTQANNIEINRLPKYWQPKRILTIKEIPLTGNGKIARRQVKELVHSLMKKETTV